MAARIRDHDWSTTSLGPIAEWPSNLKVIVDTMVSTPYPMMLAWGPSLAMLYNDAYAPRLGDRHPSALGLPLPMAWPDVWPQISPIAERVFTGEHVMFDDMLLISTRNGYSEETWWTFSLSPVWDDVHAVAGMLNVTVETTSPVLNRRERDQALDQLRDSEERQTFLLRLSDDLRPIENAAEIQRTATRLLGEQLQANRVFYVLVEPDGDAGVILRDYSRGVPSRVGRYSLSSFSSDALRQWRAGRTASTSDVNADPRYSDAERRAYASVSTRAGLGVPLIKDGRLVAILGVNQSTPREWTDRDIDLANDVAERTWEATERVRAEAAQRESEERFRQFAQASASGLWIRDAATLSMEYASPATAVIYGMEEHGLIGDVTRWASQIVPDDRDEALRQLEEARQGRSAVHEFRVQRPSDGTFRWMRNTNFPLSEHGQMTRIGGIVEDVTEARLAFEHQGILLAELQHRVRNIMAIIRSITTRTAERAGSVAEYEAVLSGRLLALARVQALLTRAANVNVGIGDIVRDEVSVQAQHEGQYVLKGSDISLSPKAAEVLTLAVHELATNALKYGALSVPEGKVTVRWDTIEKRGLPWLVFDWSEEGAPASPQLTVGGFRRTGFGSELIEGRVPYELRGTGKITIEPGGAHCHLEFPLEGGASVLETGAPQPTIIFGGALDMTGEADLSGQAILVVEDDFYLATDTARALKGAGARVLGPCSTEEQAIDLVEDNSPSGAVVDINLGTGPSFMLARHLADRGIPFLFVTGYDQEAIPSEFDTVDRLQKPLDLKRIVSGVAGLATSTE